MPSYNVTNELKHTVRNPVARQDNDKEEVDNHGDDQLSTNADRPELTKKSVQCPYCPIKFATDRVLILHIKNRHPNHDTVKKCDGKDAEAESVSCKEDAHMPIDSDPVIQS